MLEYDFDLCKAFVAPNMHKIRDKLVGNNKIQVSK